MTGSPAPIWNLVAGFCPHDAPVGPDGIRPYNADWYAALRAAEALIETEQHLDVPDRQAFLVERLRRWLVALIEAAPCPPPNAPRPATPWPAWTTRDPAWA